MDGELFRSRGEEDARLIAAGKTKMPMMHSLAEIEASMKASAAKAPEKESALQDLFKSVAAPSGQAPMMNAMTEQELLARWQKAKDAPTHSVLVPLFYSACTNASRVR